MQAPVKAYSYIRMSTARQLKGDIYVGRCSNPLSTQRERI